MSSTLYICNVDVRIVKHGVRTTILGISVSVQTENLWPDTDIEDPLGEGNVDNLFSILFNTVYQFFLSYHFKSSWSFL